MTCHRDCRNFAPVDVSKGICHRTKEMVAGDVDSCEHFDRKPKCRDCQSFKAEKDRVELGVCLASTHEPKFLAFPDMVAVTCESFRAGLVN